MILILLWLTLSMRTLGIRVSLDDADPDSVRKIIDAHGRG
jgi:hypothetical protein